MPRRLAARSWREALPDRRCTRLPSSVEGEAARELKVDVSAEERRRAARAARARNRAAIGEGFSVWEESKLEQPIGESA